ncbi:MULTISPECIES: DUF6049 family protein [Gordonia]|uniref:DUF6049 family protein n=1 Tax=Gordonia TaxID=2053 RepID=UPI00326711C7
MNRLPRRNLVDAGGARVAPPPVRADLSAARRPVSVPALSAVIALVALMLGVVPAAVAAPTAPRTSTPGSHAAPSSYATVGLTQVTPSTVTGSTGHTVTVRGRIVNTAGYPISDVAVRLQRGSRVTESYQLRSTLTASAADFGVVGPTKSVTGSLGAGRSVDFTVTAPISAAGGLGLARAGVYPLLVNVTGTPQNASTATIADSRTLLPVLSLPSDQNRARDYVAPGGDVPGVPLLGRDGSLAPNTSAPAPFTMMWPLAAPPQAAAGTLGGRTEPLRLTNDSLAHSLQADGRLGNSLRALENLVGIDGPPVADDPVRDSICLAVDPDLLLTVEQMAAGYVVTNDPADPDAADHPGQGAQAAADWMRRLTAVAARMCVTALPFAQAGLDSLHTVGDTGLSERAILDPSAIVDRLLGVRSVRGLTIPATGTMTGDGRALLSGIGIHATAIASSALTPLSPTDRSPTSGTASGRYTVDAMAVQSYDVAISAALGGAGLTPSVPAIMPNWQQPNLSNESAVSRRQAAAAALAFPMLNAPAPTAADSSGTDSSGADSSSGASDLPTTGRSAFIMPPTYWSPTVDDARMLRDTAALMLSSGTARAVPLSTLVGELPAADAPVRLTVPGDVQPDVAAGFPITQHNAETVRQRLDLIGHMQSALVGNADTVTTPAEYVQPLRDDLIRAVSSISTTGDEADRPQRDQRLTAVGKALTGMQQAVSLLDPSGRYTLASERSPLLLVVRNELALPIRVRLDIDAPATLEIGDLGTFEIPAIGTRQLQIPTHATSSEPASVHIGLVTVNDLPLSTPIELSVYANAYGKPLFWITVAAAVILVLLTARRLWHRFRGEPDPADEDRPEPDEEHLEQATLGYQDRLSYQDRLAAGRAAEPGRAEPDRPDPDRADPDMTDRDMTETGRTGTDSEHTQPPSRGTTEPGNHGEGS